MDSSKSSSLSEDTAYAIFKSQNKFREYPDALRTLMEKILTYFKGKVIHFPGNPVGLRLH